MAALITRGDMEAVSSAADVDEYCCAIGADFDPQETHTADAGVIAELAEQATDYVAEFASSAGKTLTSANVTKSIKRRIAIVAVYYGATRRTEWRDSQGRPPYHVAFAEVNAELKAWAARLRPDTTEPVAEAPVVLSDDPRGY